MVSKSLDQSFNADWEKAIAWAQTQGIGAKDYLPVYQYDAQRMADTGFPMSAAERNRAILAANNPSNVTPVPSDKPNPLSFLGNARNDLKTIFTGLAPNHLIPNIFHTAEATILHPQTWIAPIADVARGVTSGNMGDIKQGLAAAGAQNSILSWIPGVYDLSELAQGGVGNVLAHPIISFLDVAPFAPAGRVLGLAADEARMASMATRLGFKNVDDLYQASVPQIASTYLMSRDIAVDSDGTWQPRFPGAGILTKGTLVDRYGNPLSVSGAFRQWGMNHSGLSKAISFVAASAFDLRSYGTDAEMYVMAPLEAAQQKLKDPAQRQLLDDLVTKKDPRSQGKTPAQVMSDASIDPDVRDAYDKYQDVLNMGESQAGAAGGLVAIESPELTLPDGRKIRRTDYYSVTQQASTVVSAARQARHSLLNLVKAMGPAHKINQEVEQLDAQFNDYARQTQKALSDAQKAKVQGETDPVNIGKGNISLPLARQRDLLMADDGLIGKALDAGSQTDASGNPKDADFVTMRALLRAAKRDLTKNGYGRLDPSVDPTFAEVARRVDTLLQYADRRVKRENDYLDLLTKDVPKYKRRTKGEMEALRSNVLRRVDGGDETVAEREGMAKAQARNLHNEKRSSILKALHKAQSDYRAFHNEWWHNPADTWRPVLYDAMIERILKGEDKVYRTEEMVDRWRELGYADDQIDKMRSDPKILAEAIWHESQMAMTDPGGRMIMGADDMDRIRGSALDHVNQLRVEGHEVAYIPVLTSLDVAEKDPGRYGVRLSKAGQPITLSATKARNMSDFMPERYDLLASVHQSTKEAIERNITIEFANEHLAPHALTPGEVSSWLQRAFRDEFANRNADISNLPDTVATGLARRLGLVRWDPMSKVGFTFPRWGNEAVYLPAGLARAVDQLLGSEKKLPFEGVYDKGTNAFRFSILALSPRYTAHIVFGGAFLLALRSDPRIVLKMGEAFKMSKEGLPIELRQRSTEVGKEALEYPTYESVQTAGLHQANKSGAMQLAHMHVQEILAGQGILWSKASPLQWIKAIGEANYRFTDRVSTMYRAAAMLDYSAKAEKRGFFHDPVTGEKLAMTPERAKEEGIQHALKAMGNLKAMTPLERATFMRVMPFYGWTRHILNYVLTYPADHPYRAQFLTVLAAQDSDSVAKALDTRILFMFFMGSPDSQGNVKGVDVRFLDPLRDVANYASLEGWIQALNPVISAPLAMIDPNLIYGSTSLYPNVTYDQFYGIETTTNPGGGWNAVEEIIPQTSVLDAAFGLSSEYRQLAQKNPASFTKMLYESLNIPFANLQNVNMKQLAVKGEIARYDVGYNDAKNAWQSPGMGGTGIEQALAGYSSVPSPINPDYEITPAQLQALYNQALAQYPGQNPSDVVVSPPTPSGF